MNYEERVCSVHQVLKHAITAGTLPLAQPQPALTPTLIPIHRWLMNDVTGRVRRDGHMPPGALHARWRHAHWTRPTAPTTNMGATWPSTRGLSTRTPPAACSCGESQWMAWLNATPQDHVRRPIMPVIRQLACCSVRHASSSAHPCVCLHRLGRLPCPKWHREVPCQYMLCKVTSLRPMCMAHGQPCAAWRNSF